MPAPLLAVTTRRATPQLLTLDMLSCQKRFHSKKNGVSTEMLRIPGEPCESERAVALDCNLPRQACSQQGATSHHRGLSEGRPELVPGQADAPGQSESQHQQGLQAGAGTSPSRSANDQVSRSARQRESDAERADAARRKAKSSSSKIGRGALSEFLHNRKGADASRRACARASAQERAAY